MIFPQEEDCHKGWQLDEGKFHCFLNLPLHHRGYFPRQGKHGCPIIEAKRNAGNPKKIQATLSTLQIAIMYMEGRC